MVGIWFDCDESSSSHVTISKLLCVLAHCAYASRLFCRNVSPCAIVPSCMSSCRFGMTHDTVGSELKFADDGKFVNGWFEPAGMWFAEVLGASWKFTHGLCLLA